MEEHCITINIHSMDVLTSQQIHDIQMKVMDAVTDGIPSLKQQIDDVCGENVTLMLQGPSYVGTVIPSGNATVPASVSTFIQN